MGISFLRLWRLSDKSPRVGKFQLSIDWICMWCIGESGIGVTIVTNDSSKETNELLRQNRDMWRSNFITLFEIMFWNRYPPWLWDDYSRARCWKSRKYCSWRHTTARLENCPDEQTSVSCAFELSPFFLKLDFSGENARIVNSGPGLFTQISGQFGSTLGEKKVWIHRNSKSFADSMATIGKLDWRFWYFWYFWEVLLLSIVTKKGFNIILHPGHIVPPKSCHVLILKHKSFAWPLKNTLHKHAKKKKHKYVLDNCTGLT